MEHATNARTNAGPSFAVSGKRIAFVNFTEVSLFFVFLFPRVHSYAFSGIGHGLTPQISLAYSAIVRSLQNFPEAATFKMALRAHSSGSPYNAHSRSSASRYDLRSAKCL